MKWEPLCCCLVLQSYIYIHVFYFQKFIDELKICIVLYDRDGYGESDPYSARSVKSEAFDIQELADKLHLGAKFYVIGCSVGALSIWSCLKYIPHRCFFFVPLLSIIFHHFFGFFFYTLRLTLNGASSADF